MHVEVIDDQMNRGGFWILLDQMIGDEHELGGRAIRRSEGKVLSQEVPQRRRHRRCRNARIHYLGAPSGRNGQWVDQNLTQGLPGVKPLT